jgi:hypothetical protein
MAVSSGATSFLTSFLTARVDVSIVEVRTVAGPASGV